MTRTRTSSRPGSRGTRIATTTLAAVALVAGGAAAGLALAPQATPASVRAPVGPVTIEVGNEPFDDPREVTVTATEADAVTVTLAATGRVTRTDCAPGATLRSGTAPLAVDGAPVLALATAEPLWRDLARGSKGPDVTALQTELNRLGAHVVVDGVYGPGTVTAVNALFTEAGVAKPDGSLPLARVAWLPEPELVVATCGVTAGRPVGTEPFAASRAELLALTVTGDVTGGAAGARVVRLGEVTAPVGDDGRITDRTYLDAFAEANAYLLAQGEDGAVELNASYALVEPLDVTIVPPSSLYDLTDRTGCVLADGEPRAVDVIGSSLGKTMVVIGGAPVSAVAVTPVDPAPCR